MTSIPSFKDVSLAGDAVPSDAAATYEQLVAAAGASEGWQTPEHILVPPLYTQADLDGLDFLDTKPGMPPFLRGPYSTMYVSRPWTIRRGDKRL